MTGYFYVVVGPFPWRLRKLLKRFLVSFNILSVASVNIFVSGSFVLPNRNIFTRVFRFLFSLNSFQVSNKNMPSNERIFENDTRDSARENKCKIRKTQRYTSQS